MYSSKLKDKFHSLEHVMVLAIRRLYDENALLGVGPVIENGFYQDLELKLTPEDLPVIEAEMQKIIAEDLAFEYEEIGIDEAINYYRERNQTYKVELLEDIKAKGTSKVADAADAESESDEVKGLTESGKVTIYTVGIHRDLCRGPHVKSTGELKGLAFQLDRIAGAYWRGNEKNPMLTRVYGLAFADRKGLKKFLKLREEAQARDHRKLGKEQGLFFISDLVGGGLNLWTPKGTVIRQELDKFVWELRRVRGYERVTIPHITKKDLYEVSGHWEKFADELFRIRTREGDEFALKPMNCPHHTQIFAFERRSYRDMPQRYAESTMVYRDEQSGELSGLSRVRCITQDDAHVFCRRNQIKEEFNSVWDIIQEFYSKFDLKLKMRLSFHEPSEFEKYLGTPEVWAEAEEMLEELAKERGFDYFIARGEAAMYGPKTDFMAEDSLGREHQVATAQLDLNMPKRFGLYCINEDGQKEDVVMLHVAIMGSIERFCSVMIEHLAGKFPLWLSPVQLGLISVSPDQKEYVEGIAAKLEAELAAVGLELRAKLFTEDEMLQGKVKLASEQGIPYIVVAGGREMEAGTVALRMRGDRKQNVISVDELVQKLVTEIKTRELTLSV